MAASLENQDSQPRMKSMKSHFIIRKILNLNASIFQIDTENEQNNSPFKKYVATKMVRYVFSCLALY